MSKAKSTQPKKSSPAAKRQSTPRRAVPPGGVTIGRDVHCADFVGRDQNTITYGYSAADVGRLIDKVLAFLAANAAFVPVDGALRAEVNGETLTFRPGAAQQLSRCRDERAYLLSITVHRDYYAWATHFVPLEAHLEARRAADDLYLPIAYAELIPPPEGAGPEARVTTARLDNIAQALDKHDALVILGEPGAGKTTTLQKIAFDAARARLAGEPGRVPLFVRLSQQKDRSPFEFLRAEWEQHTDADFAQALARGRVLVLADGINELPRGDLHEERLKDWRIWVSDHLGQNQIVFTSRKQDYETQLNLPRVEIVPLDDERITDYLRRYHAEGLEARLGDQARLREMARNPFYLMLLTLAFLKNQRLLNDRGHLLESFVLSLFKREQDLAQPGWRRLPAEAQTRALAQLAYTMQEQGESQTFSFEIAQAALPATVKTKGEEIPIEPVTLFRFARGATILDPGIEPDVRFYHQLLHEYFAALELLKRFDADEDLSALWKCKRLASDMPSAQVGEWDALPEPPATGWEVTTILACGLARDPAKLIEAVRVHNPVLAGRCMDEAGVYLSSDPNPFIRFASVAPVSPVRADLLRDLYDPAVHLRARLQAGFTLGRIGDTRFQPSQIPARGQTVNGVQVIVPQMVSVPAGDYCLGSAENEPNSYDDEKPQHTVNLPAFALGRWPVTNAEFACFMEAGGYKDERYWTTDLAKRWLRGEDVTGGQATRVMDVWRFMQSNADWKERLEQTGAYSPDDLKAYEYIAGLSEDELKAELATNISSKSREQPGYWNDSTYNNPSQPVVGVTWFEARAYCAWLSSVTGREYRLPTEVEWEAAARGPSPSPVKGGGGGRVYPWGNDWDAAKANTIEGRVLKPSPVGTYQAAGGVGVFEAEDQSGNVWEWTSSLYRPYPYQLDDREDTEAEGERTVRGGSWDDFRYDSRCADRSWFVPGNWYNVIGFRLVSPGSISGS